MPSRAMQLLKFLALGLALATTACSGGPVYVGGPYGSIASLLILILDIVAIFQILQSGQATEKKILWIVVIIILPLIGLILWYLLGRK